MSDILNDLFSDTFQKDKNGGYVVPPLSEGERKEQAKNPVKKTDDPNLPGLEISDPAKAAQQHIAARQQAEQQKSVLGTVVSTVTDPIAHVFGGKDSDDTLKRLTEVHQEYRKAEQAFDYTKMRRLESELRTAIVQDRDAAGSEATAAGYGTNFVKMASMFAPRGYGRVASALSFGLDEMKVGSSSGEKVVDLALGSTKGLLLSKTFHTVGAWKVSAPGKGIMLGVASRGIESTLTRQNYYDQNGNFNLRYGVENAFDTTFSGSALVTDAAIFALTMGLYSKTNTLTAGALERSPYIAKVYTAGTFGVATGTASDVQRQLKEGRSFYDMDYWSVAKHGFAEGLLTAAAAGVTPAGTFKPSDRVNPGQTKVENGKVVELVTEQGRKYKFEYEANDVSTQPKKIVFPDGTVAQRSGLNTWVEDIPGKGRITHSDLYTVLADNSLMRRNPQLPGHQATRWLADGSIGQSSGALEVVTRADGTTYTHSSPLLVTRHPGVSDRFFDAIDAAVQRIPLSERLKLLEMRESIHVSPTIAQIRPDLIELQPRGWTPGSKWAMADGVHDSYNGSAVVTEFHRAYDGWKAKYNLHVKSNRGPGVIRHEVGHGMDSALNRASAEQRFIDAHTADVAAMPAPIRETLKYLIQADGAGKPSAAGRQEAFAELYGQLRGGGAASWISVTIDQFFPRTKGVVQDMLNEIK